MSRFIHTSAEGDGEIEFRELVAQSTLQLWEPGGSIPSQGTLILIGVATWNRYDLQLLDLLDGAVSRATNNDSAVAVFNIGSRSKEVLQSIIPGIDPIFPSPIIGIWTNGVLVRMGNGQPARDLVARMFGSSSDEIVLRVTNRQVASHSAVAS